MEDSDEIGALGMEEELIELMTGLTVDDLAGGAEIGGEGMAEHARQQSTPRVH